MFLINDGSFIMELELNHDESVTKKDRSGRRGKGEIMKSLRKEKLKIKKK